MNIKALIYLDDGKIGPEFALSMRQALAEVVDQSGLALPVLDLEQLSSFDPDHKHLLQKTILSYFLGSTVRSKNGREYLSAELFLESYLFTIAERSQYLYFVATERYMRCKVDRVLNWRMDAVSGIVSIHDFKDLRQSEALRILTTLTLHVGGHLFGIPNSKRSDNGYCGNKCVMNLGSNFMDAWRYITEQRLARSNPFCQNCLADLKNAESAWAKSFTRPFTANPN